MKQIKKVDFKKTRKFVECKKCLRLVEVDSSANGALCWRCLQSLVGNPPEKKMYIKKATNRPRGWQFMKVFVDRDGTVYHRGNPQPELKGTLKPTDIKKIKKEQEERKKDKLSAKKKIEIEIQKEIAKRNKHLTESGYAKKKRRKKKK